ncbi:sensor histidine kinase [Tychonema sp. LEGE 07203]|uniref:sensor histidine kinase n=1 Tax=Tychonema sp. LEGE 07203 TaxID=1828671 RepID=UPI001D134D00|nr:ATP-binding protein [Tychonema sp. LEGE 07203]
MDIFYEPVGLRPPNRQGEYVTVSSSLRVLCVFAVKSFKGANTTSDRPFPPSYLSANNPAGDRTRNSINPDSKLAPHSTKSAYYPRSPKPQTSHPITIRIRTLLVDGQWVQVHIADNGSGIDAEAIAKIYDPFYTTKPIGYGTGLGLAISDRIIKTHEGYLRCTSEIGKGTEFMIKIPLKSKPQPAACSEKFLVKL